MGLVDVVDSSRGSGSSKRRVRLQVLFAGAIFPGHTFRK
jgi:hypothetical protein